MTEHIPRTLATATMAAIVLASLTLPAGAAPRMTRFDPASDGFRFVNSFKNDFVRELDIRTGGLCGGMVYAALDYHTAHRPIPTQDHRPAVQTTLHDYIYDRQVTSLVENADKWAELGLNPFGARSSEFFEWGLKGTKGGRLQELCAAIDRGRPVPLGMQEYGDGGPGNHQVLAIGYDLGRYRGDLGAHKEDLRIFIYDPNHPRQVRTLAPDLSKQAFHYVEDPAKRWRTYFVDAKYRPHTPSAAEAALPTTEAGLASELVVELGTGGDDLRGGNDNVDLAIHVRGRTPQMVRNINQGRRWIDNYGQTVRIPLEQPVAARDITAIVLSTTFSGGMGGDNWNLDRVKVTARGSGVDEIILERRGSPLFRFTSDRKILELTRR